jgi:hypothetical protein
MTHRRRSWGRYSKQIGIRISAADAAKIAQYCEHTGQYPAQVMRDLIRSIPGVPPDDARPSAPEEPRRA